MKPTLLAAAFVVAMAGPAPGAMLRVTSSADGGAGSLRAAIEAANASPGSTIELSGEALTIVVGRALPAIRARGTTLDGRGATLREAAGCERPGGRTGCDGLVVTGAGITIRNVRVAGFLLDGISVRGRGATGVRIQNVDAIDNLDDGVGVSDGAGPVTVERSLLMGNGFRTKGKGLLVFSDSTATLRDSTVVANRDGVTVSRDSQATLERVIVAGNYDKGVGVSAGRLRGSELLIAANGIERDGTPAPNGDGVRVGLGGKLELADSRIAASGDSGVVVLDTSSATLRNCHIDSNRGPATRVAETAQLEER